MRIDLLKLLVPKVYKFRQKVLDAIFAIAKANPKPTCHLKELTQRLGKDEDEIHMVILYLVRIDYAKHVGNHGEPLYALEKKGQSASIDKEFWRTGRNERYKNVLAYGAWLGLISTTLAIATALYIAPKMVHLEERIESMEQRVIQQSQEVGGEKAPIPRQSVQPSTKIDSVSLSKDSAMPHTAVYERTNP